LELLGPPEFRNRSWLTALLALTLGVTTLIGAGTALGFTFDPRYRDFPFASLTMAVVPFALLTLLNRPKEGVRPICRIRVRRTIGGGSGLQRPQRGRRQLAVALELRDVCAAGAHGCGGRGPCKSENEQADRKPRQRDIVEHDPKARRRSARGSTARSKAASRGAQRSPAAAMPNTEFLNSEVASASRFAQHGLQAGVAGQPVVENSTAK